MWHRRRGQVTKKGANGSSTVGCAALSATGETGTIDKDFPGYYGDHVPDNYEAWIYGVIRIYSGCPEGKKTQLQWWLKFTKSEGATGGAWPGPDGGAMPKDWPEFPEGGPPANPDRGNPYPPEYGDGTDVGDEGPQSEADQPDANTGKPDRYGVR